MTHQYPELVTMGEVLGAVSSTVPGPLEVGTPFRLSFAGAEATVAIATARLGVSSAIMGRVGDDALGRLIRRRLGAEGVDVGSLGHDTEHPTAMLLKYPRAAGRVEVSYARRDSAGSFFGPDEVDLDLIRSARLLHITGITPALGRKPAAAVHLAVDVAREAGVEISLDVNYRGRLWNREAASAVLKPLARVVDILIAGTDELSLVAADEDELLETGVREVVVTDGASGARVVTAEGRWELPALAVPVVDPVGAGDSFVGGYLAARLRGAVVRDRLEQGIRVGAMAVATLGDWEGLPSSAELDVLERSEVHR